MGTGVNIPVDFKVGDKELDKKFSALEKRSAKTKENLQKIGIAAGVSFAAIGTAIGISTRNFAKFQNELIGVKTLLDKNSFAGKTLGKGFKELTDDALKLGSTAPVALTELNKALFDTVSAGVAADDAIQVLEESSRLAAAGLTDISTATDGVTSALNAYGLEAEDAQTISALFFQAQKQGKTTISELSNFFGTAASSAAAYGVSLEELLSAVSAATTAGIATSQAFTGVKAILTNIAKPTEEAATEAKRLGIEFNFTAIKTMGLNKFLKQLTESSGFTDKSITKLFGSMEAQKLAFALTGQQADKFASTLDKLNDKQKVLKEFNAAADESLATLQNRFKVLDNATNVLSIKFGEQFAPAITAVTNSAIELVNTLSNNKPLVVFVASLASIAAVAALVVAGVAAIKLGLIALAGTVGVAITKMLAFKAILGFTGLAGAFTALKLSMDDADDAAAELASGSFKALTAESERLNKELVSLQETQSKFPSASQLINKSRNEEIKTILEEIEAIDDLIEKKKVEANSTIPLRGAGEVEETKFVFGELLSARADFNEKDLLLREEKSEAEKEMDANKAAEDLAKAEEEREFKKQLKQFEEDDFTEVTKMGEAGRLKLINDFNKTKQKNSVKNKAKELAAQGKFDQARRVLDVAQAEEMKKREEEKYRVRVQYANLTVQALNVASGIIAATSGKQNKAAYAFSKAAAIAQATISTIVAANVALASAPPPANAALAATTMGIGFANVALIAGTAIQGFAKGGFAQGPGTMTEDSIPAMVKKNEFMVPPESADKVINSAADQRNLERDFEFNDTENSMQVEIGFTENAFEIIERKLFERQALGISTL